MKSMAYLIAFEGKTPQIAEDVYLAPTAVLIGDVVLEPRVSVWFGAVLRADFNRIVVGAGSCVQDNVVIHTSKQLPTIIGSDVVIGHLAYLEACEVGAGAVVGAGSLILPGAKVGRRAVVAAGSVVKQGMVIPPEVLIAGVPAEVKKPLSGNSKVWVEQAAQEYNLLRLRYLKNEKTTH